MALLEDMLRSFNPSELKEIEIRLQKRVGSGLRKDAKVLLLLLNDPPLSPHQIANELYGSDNLNAYHTLRKRLTKHVHEFVYTRSVETDIDKKEKVHMLVKSARFLLSRSKVTAAQKVLSQAKKMASSNSYYTQLLEVFNTEVQHADELGLDHEKLVEEWRSAESLAEVQQRTDLVHSLLRIKLREARSTGRTEGLDKLVRSQIDALGIEVTDDLPVKVFYKILTMIRMAIIASKQYHQFEPLIEHSYKLLERDGRWEKGDKEVKIGFSYMLAQTKYRLGKLEEALTWLNEMGKFLHNAPLRLRYEYEGRYLMLKGSVLMFKGDRRGAYEVLQAVEERPETRINDQLNIRLNRAIFYVLTKEHKKAKQVLRQLELTDRECEKHMGKEWRFKKDLLEVMVFVDLDSPELALSRLAYIQTHYADFFQHERFRRAGDFIRLIKKSIQRPELLQSKAFAEALDKEVEKLPVNQEDIQAVTFYCWLTARMKGVDYYDHLISTVRKLSKYHRQYISMS